MTPHSDGASYLQSVTFKLAYPASPFYPADPVFAQFSGVLTAEGQLHVKLIRVLSLAIPTCPVSPSEGLSAVLDETPMSFSGVLSDDRIHGSARLTGSQGAW